jgi:glycerol kinase
MAAKRGAAVRRPAGDLVLAIDQGTTSSKAVLVDEKLRPVAEASREFPQHFPRPGWVEHDPEEIYASVRGAVSEVLARTEGSVKRLAAVGITNQRETTLVWERSSGKAIENAIVWQDRRTAADCDKLKRRGLEAAVRRRTGLVLDPYFSGTKLAWLLDHAPGARRLAAAGQLLFGTIDTYLVWRLSGGAAHVTDVSNASRTLLLDLGTCRWSPAMCELLRIPPRLLPEVRDNDEVFATTANLDFLPAGIPIASVIGDQQAALFGQACFAPGEAKCTYGTGAFLLLNTGARMARSRHGLLTTAAWRLGGKTCYALEGSVFIAGAIVQWLRDGLGIIASSSEVEALARTVPDAGGVTLVPALAGLGAPHWRPEARGLLSGLTRGANRGHIARAALEGIAFQVRDLADAMARDLGRALRALKVDGGAAANDLLLQFQADILGRPVVRPRVTSTTALGAALLAGLTVGLFPSLAAIRKSWSEERRFLPRLPRREAQEHLRRWQAAVKKVIG